MQRQNLDRVSALCVGYSTAIGLVLGGLAVVFGRQLAGIYAPGDPLVIAAAEERMLYVCTLYFICGLMDTMVGILRGLGHSVVPMIVSLVGACGLRLLWVAFVFPFFGTPAALYISYPISWAVTAAMHAGFFFVVRKHAYAKVRRETAGVRQ